MPRLIRQSSSFQIVHTIVLTGAMIALVTLVPSAVAFAQTATTSPPATTPTPDDQTPTPALKPAIQIGRAVFTALGGTSFGETEASVVYGGGIGLAITPHLQVGGEFGRDDDVITKSLHDSIRDTSTGLAPTLGSPVTFATSEPLVYGMGDVRLSMATSDLMGMYAQVGVGVAHVSPAVSASANGVDVTSDITSTVTMPSMETKLMTSVDAGFTVKLGERSMIVAGYRYSRIMTAVPLNTNGIYGGIQARF